jgi:glycosyltransferase involved in cell wall biosynthesis
MDSILPLPEGCEWIVVDGASTDGTAELLNTISGDNITVLSEKDAGIFDAMNKGIYLAKGEYLNFMNSGDFFHREPFVKVMEQQFKGADILSFDYTCLNAELREVNTNLLSSDSEDLRSRSSIPHQSALIKNRLFTELGTYDESFTLSGDYEFFARALKAGVYKFKFFPEIYLACFVLDGVTSKNRSCLAQGKQHYCIQTTHFNKASKRRFLMFFTRYIMSFIPMSDLLLEKYRQLHFSKRNGA